jgi:hypothetical protein
MAFLAEPFSQSDGEMRIPLKSARIPKQSGT